MRAFVAVDVGTEARRALRDAQHQLEAVLPRGAVRWTKPDQLHLTLWFLGEAPEEQLPALCQALTTALNGAMRFRLHLAGLGAFPTPRSPRVLWLGLAGDLPQLLDVQRRVAQTASPFGEHQEARPFHPHLTLGRVSRPDAAVARAFADWMAGRPPTGSGPWGADLAGQPGAMTMDRPRRVRGPGLHVVGPVPSPGGSWVVEAVRLIQSVLRPAGSAYTELARFELRPGQDSG